MSQRPAPAWMEKIYEQRGLIVPLGFIMLLGVVIVPLPAWLLDILISLNISLGVIVLLTTVYMQRTIEFSVFPSLLLATTLLRLVLNIASTRLILTADASSPEQAMGVAGKVISAFGAFVAGDSLVVGVIIFLILILVQFLVITKGATRISEVAARFTLDALPGKQMAIDADVAAGNIDESEARVRRDEIRREADFFGAMDGASKFVRGDAIAGLLITAINIVGGFAIGAIERGWPAGQTAEVFTRLTIGDGIASSLPSFVIAIASALLVTRSSDQADLGTELTGQLTSQPKGLLLTAGFLTVLAFTGLPRTPLLLTAGVLGVVAVMMMRSGKRKAAQAVEQAEAEATQQNVPTEAPVEELLKVDVLELEVGYHLVQLVEPARGPSLLDRISATRRQLAIDLGLVMPPVRIRDNVQLGPKQYRLKIRGSVVAEGELEPDLLLAMDPGIATGTIEGMPTREPAFGLDASWIVPDLKQRAESMNYTVVDPTSVLATHIAEVVKRHAEELLTREEVNNLLTQLKEQAPKLVEDTVPAVLTIQQLQRVLQGLLREGVPIRDLESVLETLSEWAPKTKDVDVLIEYARNGLKRSISQQIMVSDDQGTQRIHCVALDPAWETKLESYIDRSGGITNVSVPPNEATRLTQAASASLESLASLGHSPVVLASPAVRAVVRQILAPHVPGLTVIAYNEVADGIELESQGLISERAPQVPQESAA